MQRPRPASSWHHSPGRNTGGRISRHPLSLSALQAVCCDGGGGECGWRRKGGWRNRVSEVEYKIEYNMHKLENIMEFAEKENKG